MLGNSDLLKIRDKHQNTLLHIACGFGRLKSAQCLMKFSPTLVDQIDDKGHNPIDVAIKVNTFELICLLSNF
jgi:ankyrin repeat protein